MQSSSIKTCSINPQENYGQGKLKRFTAKTNEIIAKLATNLKCVKLNMSGQNSNICKQQSTANFEPIGRNRIFFEMSRIECSEKLQRSNFLDQTTNRKLPDTSTIITRMILNAKTRGRDMNQTKQMESPAFWRILC